MKKEQICYFCKWSESTLNWWMYCNCLDPQGGRQIVAGTYCCLEFELEEEKYLINKSW